MSDTHEIGEKRDRGNGEEENEHKDKTIKTENNDHKREESCAICLGSEDLLSDHNCPVCVSRAWNICAECDEHTLARACPICQSAYKPWTFHPVPTLPQFPLDFSVIADPYDRLMATTRFQLIIEFIRGTNTLIYDTVASEMHFFLPKSLNAPINEMELYVTSMKVASDRFVGGTFEFGNSVWDELSRHSEGEAADGDTEVVDAQPSQSAETAGEIEVEIPVVQALVEHPAEGEEDAEQEGDDEAEAPEENAYVTSKAAYGHMLRLIMTNNVVVMTRMTPAEWDAFFAEILPPRPTDLDEE